MPIDGVGGNDGGWCNIEGKQSKAAKRIKLNYCRGVVRIGTKLSIFWPNSFTHKNHKIHFVI